MKIAGDICVYTNHNIIVEVIDPENPINPPGTGAGTASPSSPTLGADSGAGSETPSGSSARNAARISVPNERPALAVTYDARILVDAGRF